MQTSTYTNILSKNIHQMSKRMSQLSLVIGCLMLSHNDSYATEPSDDVFYDCAAKFLDISASARVLVESSDNLDVNFIAVKTCHKNGRDCTSEEKEFTVQKNEYHQELKDFIDSTKNKLRVCIKASE